MIIEVGSGDGVLTAALAKRAARVRGVEIDGRLVRALRTRFRDVDNVSITEADFLRYPLPAGEPYKVFGNIPFNRTAAIIEKLVQAEQRPRDVYVLVQREAAERYAGTPFAPESSMSLLLKPWWQVEVARRLRRSDFDPPPRVDVVALWLAYRERPLVHPHQARMYRAFIKRSFGRSGNTVSRCLRTTFTRRQLRRLGRDLRFDLSAPPGHLTFDQWLGLFRFMARVEAPSTT